MIDRAVNLMQGRLKAREIAITLHKKEGWGPVKVRQELLKLGFNISANTLGGWLYSSARPGKPWKKNKIPESAKKLTKEKAYILGVLAGDGYFSYGSMRRKYPGTIGLSATDKEFVDEFASCLEQVYGLKSSRFTKGKKAHNRKPSYVAEIYSVEVAKDMFSYGVNFGSKSWMVPEAIKRAQLEIKRSYLRGFFDSEGTVYFRENRDRYVAAFSTNLEGLKKIGKLLAGIEIESKISQEAWYYKIKISKRENLRKFAELVGFTIKRKMRKLEQALSAYKCTPSAEVDALVPKMARMRKQGMSFSEIEKKLGVDKTTVHKRLSGNSSKKFNVFEPPVAETVEKACLHPLTGKRSPRSCYKYNKRTAVFLGRDAKNN